MDSPLGTSWRCTGRRRVRSTWFSRHSTCERGHYTELAEPPDACAYQRASAAAEPPHARVAQKCGAGAKSNALQQLIVCCLERQTELGAYAYRVLLSNTKLLPHRAVLSARVSATMWTRSSSRGCGRTTNAVTAAEHPLLCTSKYRSRVEL